jgi:nitrile hydratase accessory protein
MGTVQPEISAMRGPEALPRHNGELVFAAPWEGRALAMAIGAVQSLGLPWDAFRSRLIAEIAQQPERPYYESWLSALERLLCERGVLSE